MYKKITQSYTNVNVCRWTLRALICIFSYIQKFKYINTHNFVSMCICMLKSVQICAPAATKSLGSICKESF